MFAADKIIIVGVGLIGGSLALALKKFADIGEIVGVSRSESTLQTALERNVIDRASHSLPDELADASIVVIAVPVQVTRTVLQVIADGDYRNAIVTDVGSVKGAVMQAARETLAPDYDRFIGGHPIAGIEQSGVAAAFPELFVDRYTIITPDESADPQSVETIRQMWTSVGSTVRYVDVHRHDMLLAAASHLPHMLAYSLVDYIDKHELGNECFEFAAGGFHDFTRIASSDAVMWRDICIANAEHVAANVDAYIGHLESVRNAIIQGDGETLEKMFLNARRARNELLLSKK